MAQQTFALGILLIDISDDASITFSHFHPKSRLEEFRQVAYKYLGRAKDATFELTDAILLKLLRLCRETSKSSSSVTLVGQAEVIMLISTLLIGGGDRIICWKPVGGQTTQFKDLGARTAQTKVKFYANRLTMIRIMAR
ncbi:hypothetical protein [Nostoc sp.]|uniref:hypothetical protein n=1 Tax=Nostoc sp. TaxID=1180 RepID=UPI002FFA07F2